MPPRRDPYAFAAVTPEYAEQIELRQDISEMQRVKASPLATSGQKKEAQKRITQLSPLYEVQKATVASMPTKLITPTVALGMGSTVSNGVIGTMSLANLGQWFSEWYKDMMRGLDVLLPEEILGLDITPQARVGAEKKGRTFYDDVWVEDGKIKVMRKGSLRVLGYTPVEAKKRFKTRRRRKRLTKRDIYIIEALKDGASPAAVAML